MITLKRNKKEETIMADERKEIEVVSGDGSELDISPAYEHLNDVTPKSAKEKKPKDIVVPEEISKKEEGGNKEDE